MCVVAVAIPNCDMASYGYLLGNKRMLDNMSDALRVPLQGLSHTHLAQEELVVKF